MKTVEIQSVASDAKLIFSNFNKDADTYTASVNSQALTVKVEVEGATEIKKLIETFQAMKKSVSNSIEEFSWSSKEEEFILKATVSGKGNIILQIVLNTFNSDETEPCEVEVFLKTALDQYEDKAQDLKKMFA